MRLRPVSGSGPIPSTHTISNLSLMDYRLRCPHTNRYYGRGQKVQSSTVSSAITAIGETIAMACKDNPTKVMGSNKFLPELQVMIEAYVLLPIWSQTLFRNRDFPYGKLFATWPIPAWGLPVWLWGLVFLPSPESQVPRRAT
jgi:hypothetical protein